MSAIKPSPRQIAGACDCHLHFYGSASEYPRIQEAVYDPPAAQATEYAAVMQSLGLERLVAVQSVIYGTDNRCMLDGMQGMKCQTRGIAVVPVDSDWRHLEALHDSGVRGIRAFMLEGGFYEWPHLKTLAGLVNTMGWHLDVQLNGRELELRGAWLSDLGCSLVIDHIGKFIPPVDTDHPAFLELRRLVDGGHCWVKLSAPYESSTDGAPYFEDVGRLATALIQQAPERMLWGSNWPHTGQTDPPDDAELFRLLAEWAPSRNAQTAILHKNPQELYEFGAPKDSFNLVG